MAGVWLVSVFCFWRLATGYPRLQLKIPNGHEVVRNGLSWPGVGHRFSVGGGDLNVFGHAFARAHYKWTDALCRADSDGDGQSNGLELGDPDCIWEEGDEPSRTSGISHPGYENSVTHADVTPNTSSTTSTTPNTTLHSTELLDPSSIVDDVAISGGGGCEPSNLAVPNAKSKDLYACQFKVTGGVTLHWRSRGAEVDLALVKDQSSGWLALGLPAAGRPSNMIPAHAFVALPDGSTGTYSLEGFSEDDVIPCEDKDLPAKYTSSSAEYVAGSIILRIEGLSFNNAQEKTPLLHASSASTRFPEYHGGSLKERGSFMVDLEAGTASASARTEELSEWSVHLHGVLQVIAWAFLAPLAITVKRFFKGRFPCPTIAGWPAGFALHASLMTSSVLCCIAGVGIALARFESRALFFHGLLGKAVAFCALLQLLPAFFCRPASEQKPRERNVFNVVHRTGGIVILLLACVSMATGIKNLDLLRHFSDTRAYFAAVLMGLALSAGLAVILFWFNLSNSNANSDNSDAGSAEEPLGDLAE